MPKIPEMLNKKPLKATKTPFSKQVIKKSTRTPGAPKICVEEKLQKTPLPPNEKSSLDLPNALVVRKTETGYQGKLDVSNVSYPFENNYMCYRVRASVPDRYRISNPMGCIQSGTHVNISISTEPKLKNALTFDQIKNDYFEIDAAPMPIKNATQSSLFSFWKKNAEGKTVERYRIEHILLFGILGKDKDQYSALPGVQELAFSNSELELMNREAALALKKSCEELNPLEDMAPFERLMAWMKIMLEDATDAIPTGKRETYIIASIFSIVGLIVFGLAVRYFLS